MKRTRLRSRPRASQNDAELSAAWHAAVLRAARCLVCGGRRNLQAHHIIGQSALMGIARSLRLTRAQTQEILWDPDNGAAVCERCHERHTNGYRRIPRYLLPSAVYVFVERIDKMTGRQAVLERLRREYPE